MLLFHPFLLLSQGEWNLWYFGDHTGLDFNQGVPVVLSNNAMYALGTTSSVADSMGNLLFYSDGIYVYNRSHTLMPNGSWLFGYGYPFGQGVFAVQMINYDSIYYLFTLDAHLYPNPGIYYGLRFSVIDMRLDNQKGDIVLNQKNLPIYCGSQASHALTGIRHQNNRDVWIITHLYHPDSNYYAAYLINPDGIDTIPVLSSSQIVLNYLQTSPFGRNIKISQDATKLACIYTNDNDTNYLEFCSFNSSTGIINPLFSITPSIGNYGPYIPLYTEFSRDGKHIYILTKAIGLGPVQHNAVLFQYDAEPTDSLAFKQSETIIAITSRGGLQLAPDGTIIGTEAPFIDFLSIVHNPSLPGPACNYEVNAIYLNGNCGEMGLPQFLQKYKAYIHYIGNCQIIPVQFSGDIWPPADTIRWNFGDPASGASNISYNTTPVHVYTTPGQYTIELYVRHIDNRTDTSWITISINETPDPDLGPNQTICQGDSITLDAGASTGCTFEWSSIPSGFTSTEQTVTLNQSGTYIVAVTSTSGCVGRDTIQLTVTAPPIITNSPLFKSICSGEATDIPLASNLPGTSFSWNATSSSPFIIGFGPGTGDTIDQVLTNTGASPETVTYTITPFLGDCEGDSVEYVVTVTPGDSVLVSISVSEDSICEGTQVTYIATPIHGGANPAYQWMVNGIYQGVNNAAVSNELIMTVYPNLEVSIFISTVNNPVCEGLPVSFAATHINGGAMPVYQWQVNGINTGTNNPILTYTPTNGDFVICILTSNAECITNNPATSNSITMSVGEAPDVSFTVCFDTITTLTAKPFKLKGGIPLGGTYSGSGAGWTSETGWTFYPAMAGPGIHEITYTYINSAGCKDSSRLSIVNYQLSIVNCGDSLTDIRDNKKYPTIQIGSQCWLAANLNYGVQISGSQSQRDNCIVEKYCYNDIPELCALRSALYQWDELMRYEDAEEIQGLCPPGWHVPSEADWDQLFAVYQGNAFAGSPLLFTGYSGFNVLLVGVEFFNQSNRFADFASIMWSSTSHGPYKAWSHGLNEYNYSVSYYPSYRSNAFSVRCVRD